MNLVVSRPCETGPYNNWKYGPDDFYSRCEEIDHDNFTLVKYITKHKLTKVRLYILSKASSEKFKYQQIDVIPLSDYDSDLMAVNALHHTKSN